MPGPFPTWIDPNAAELPQEAGAYRVLPWAWYNGSDLYVLLGNWDRAGPNRWLEVHKSGDRGFTWAEQDAANRPLVSLATGRFHARRLEGTSQIFIAYYAPATFEIRLRIFDMATDTWSADIGAVGSPVLDPMFDSVTDVMPLPDNTIRVVYRQRVLGVSHTYHARYNLGIGAWGPFPTTDLIPTTQRFAQEATIMEAGGKYHFFYYNSPNRTHYHRTIDLADAISADDPVYTDPPPPAANSSIMMMNSCFHAGTHIKIAFRRWVAGPSMPFVLSGTPIADAMVWTEEPVDPIPSILGVGGYFVASHAGAMHYWIARGNAFDPGAGGIHQIWHYEQPGGAGVWGPREVYYDMVAVPPAPPPAYNGWYIYYPSVIVFPDNTTFGSTYFGMFFEAHYDLGGPGLDEPTPVYLAYTPSPAPVTGSRIGLKGRTLPGSCPKSREDDCLNELAAQWLKIEWCKLRDRDLYCFGLSALGFPDEMPEQSQGFDRRGAILTPAPAAGDVEVFRWQVPFGYDAVIMGWYHAHVGLGFQDGSGDILWRIQVAGRWLKDMGQVNHTMGDWRHEWPVDGTVVLRSGNLLRYLVAVPNVSGMIPVGVSRIVCGVRGFLTPSWR